MIQLCRKLLLPAEISGIEKSEKSDCKNAVLIFYPIHMQKVKFQT
jgi:hypothetical protein